MILAHAQARLRWPRGQDVPLGGGYNVYAGPSGAGVDYDSPLNAAPIPAWPDLTGNTGDGLGRDGDGPDGVGGGGLGDGMGLDGGGPDAVGALAMEFLTEPLADGDWLFAVLPVDAAGNAADSPADVEAALALAGEPAPPGAPTADAYDGDTDTLTLEWDLSPDDEG
jgi:hypothetical protein